MMNAANGAGVAIIVRTLVSCASVFLMSGCSVFPWWASANGSGRGNNTAARVTIAPDVMRDDMFIGLAISGGGSRAANFGAAVMFELADLGLLQKVDVISSVSGGSVAAAYYALDGSRGISFTRSEVDERFARNLQLRWFARWLDPRNALRYWFTAFDRSDIMVQVFDANLFHGARFADLSPRPSVLINASNFVNGRKFVFPTRSSIASVPISQPIRLRARSWPPARFRASSRT